MTRILCKNITNVCIRLIKLYICFTVSGLVWYALTLSLSDFSLRGTMAPEPFLSPYRSVKTVADSTADSPAPDTTIYAPINVSQAARTMITTTTDLTSDVIVTSTDGKQPRGAAISSSGGGEKATASKEYPLLRNSTKKILYFNKVTDILK